MFDRTIPLKERLEEGLSVVQITLGVEHLGVPTVEFNMPGTTMRQGALIVDPQLVVTESVVDTWYLFARLPGELEHRFPGHQYYCINDDQPFETFTYMLIELVSIVATFRLPLEPGEERDLTQWYTSKTN